MATLPNSFTPNLVQINLEVWEILPTLAFQIKNMPTQKVVRNAKTGRFAKKSKAKSAPSRHVTETVKHKTKKK